MIGGERRERDSNPRYPYEYSRFRVRSSLPKLLNRSRQRAVPQQFNALFNFFCFFPVIALFSPSAHTLAHTSLPKFSINLSVQNLNTELSTCYFETRTRYQRWDLQPRSGLSPTQSKSWHPAAPEGKSTLPELGAPASSSSKSFQTTSIPKKNPILKLNVFGSSSENASVPNCPNSGPNTQSFSPTHIRGFR
jgi:hypothetical protein